MPNRIFKYLLLKQIYDLSDADFVCRKKTYWMSWWQRDKQSRPLKFAKTGKIENDLTRDMHFASDHSLFRYQCWCSFCNRVHFNIFIVIFNNVFVFLAFFSHSISAILTHTNSMTKTFCCKNKMVVLLLN